MQLALPGKPHLTYCTNIHEGETWAEIESALHRYLPEVKRAISPDAPMGVGLRLSAVAARELSRPKALTRFAQFLDDGGFYIFTINAFPYGGFHGRRVKERVYEPDWRTPDRLRFTIEAANLLAALLPEGVAGSVSTVPGAFRANATTPVDVAAIVEALVHAAAALHRIRETSGKTIALAVEPEPACLLETTEEAIRFLQDEVFSARSAALFASLVGTTPACAEDALRRHVGLCFDVCHSAVAFEDTAVTLDAVRAAGIGIAKLQLSSALRAEGSASDFERWLSRFDDGIYLHQTVERRDGILTRHVDLPEAFAAARRGEAGGEWRVHCHVPVFLAHYEELGSTQANLREALALCREREVAQHLEIETYTWGVLPPGARTGDIGSDIIRELQWVRAELSA
ncbi:metabolite traffic protein EboE [Hyphomicrobium sp.]|uniref:metabolite traffic protein EboE n=1 Tax=Hyphomicrobium sp. TaxID=82 RepID=UPI0025B83743|nr:metabolite traffic protein EboE [Hyphomicrobium sp.]MCC7250304.1 metabolite traffic protein EboE [Hyphomicrobium sp.]